MYRFHQSLVWKFYSTEQFCSLPHSGFLPALTQLPSFKMKKGSDGKYDKHVVACRTLSLILADLGKLLALNFLRKRILG